MFKNHREQDFLLKHLSCDVNHTGILLCKMIGRERGMNWYHSQSDFECLGMIPRDVWWCLLLRQQRKDKKRSGGDHQQHFTIMKCSPHFIQLLLHPKMTLGWIPSSLVTLVMMMALPLTWLLSFSKSTFTSTSPAVTWISFTRPGWGEMKVQIL